MFVNNAGVAKFNTTNKKSLKLQLKALSLSRWTRKHFHSKLIGPSNTKFTDRQTAKLGDANRTKPNCINERTIESIIVETEAWDGARICRPTWRECVCGLVHCLDHHNLDKRIWTEYDSIVAHGIAFRYFATGNDSKILKSNADYAFLGKMWHFSRAKLPLELQTRAFDERIAQYVMRTRIVTKNEVKITKNKH